MVAWLGMGWARAGKKELVVSGPLRGLWLVIGCPWLIAHTKSFSVSGYSPYKVTYASDYFDQLYAWAVELIHR